MSFFGRMFGAQKPPPVKKRREPTPVEPPPVEKDSSKPGGDGRKGGMFDGLEIKNKQANAAPATSGNGGPGMFSGLNLNTADAKQSSEADSGGGGGAGGDDGGMSAFGFLDDEDQTGTQDDAFGFLGGDDGNDDGGAAVAAEEGGGGEEGAATAGEQVPDDSAPGGSSAFAFLGGGEENGTEDDGKEPATADAATHEAAVATSATAVPAADNNKTDESEESPTAEGVPGKLFAGLTVGGEAAEDEQEGGGEGDGEGKQEVHERQTTKSDEQPQLATGQETGSNIAKTSSDDSGNTALTAAKSKTERMIESANGRLTNVLLLLCNAKQKFYKDRAELEAVEQRAREGIAEAEARRAKAQKEEEAAIEAEDYEAADAKSKELDELKAEANRLAVEGRKAAEARAVLDATKAAAIASSLGGLQEVAHVFSKLAEERVTEKKGYIEENTERLQRLEDKASAALQRVERKLGHTEVDRKHTDEEEADIAAAIERETKDVSAKRETLETEAIELEMEEAKKGYNRQLSRIAEKREGILKDQMEAKGEKEDLQTQLALLKEQADELKTKAITTKTTTIMITEEEKDFDESITQLLHSSQGVEKLVVTLKEEKRIVEEEDDGGESNDGTSAAAPNKSEVSKLQDRILAIAAQVKDITNKRNTKEEELFELKATVEKIALSLPSLNERKKAAVKRRAFKDAARVAAEIKSLSGKRDSAAKEADDAKGGGISRDMQLHVKEWVRETKNPAHFSRELAEEKEKEDIKAGEDKQSGGEKSDDGKLTKLAAETKAKLEALENEIHEREAEIDAAAEAEDYDKADALVEANEVAKAEISSLKETLSRLEEELGERSALPQTSEVAPALQEAEEEEEGVGEQVDDAAATDENADDEQEQTEEAVEGAGGIEKKEQEEGEEEEEEPNSPTAADQEGEAEKEEKDAIDSSTAAPVEEAAEIAAVEDDDAERGGGGGEEGEGEEGGDEAMADANTFMDDMEGDDNEEEGADACVDNEAGTEVRAADDDNDGGEAKQKE
eukprot:jgi/Bigna1/74842/fgenesh1_pg.31_\